MRTHPVTENNTVEEGEDEEEEEERGSGKKRRREEEGKEEEETRSGLAVQTRQLWRRKAPGLTKSCSSS